MPRKTPQTTKTDDDATPKAPARKRAASRGGLEPSQINPQEIGRR